MKKILYRLLSLCTFGFVITSAVFIFFFIQFTAPGPLDNKTNLIIPKGLTLPQIAKYLEKENVIDNHLIFRTGVHLFNKAHKLRAGEFSFDAHISPRDIMDVLLNDLEVQRKVTFIEGMTVKQILNIIEKTEGLLGEIPENIPAEGTLFPDTYYFHYGENKDDILGRMTTKMTQVLNELWENRSKDSFLHSKEEVLILASIVEKETGLKEEKTRIASVFLNRLKKNMRLQSDPTIIYFLSDKLGKIDRPVLRKDFELPSPYNTYRNAGLPPTAIANPGYDSIFAVLNPIITQDLYFVANGQGGHAFAETLDQHNRNVQTLRQIQQEQESAQ